MVRWILETTVFERESHALIAEIKRQGHELYLADGKEVLWGAKPLPYHGCEKAPTIVRGSIEFCGYVNRECEWYPGCYMTMDNYDCTNYYPIFGDYLLNSEYVMLPFGELGRRKNWLFDKIGEKDTLFVRPNRGNKIFAGQLVYKENWDKDLSRLGFYDVQPNELCVVARPYKVQEEFRFVVVRDKVICGTEYKNHNNDLISPYMIAPEWVFKKAQSIVNDKCGSYTPDTVWCLDLCSCNGELYVLEVGAFSCAGLYGCPTDVIVEEVSKVIQEEWDEVYV